MGTRQSLLPLSICVRKCVYACVRACMRATACMHWKACGRTPGTGLYDNLQKYDLPSPQSIFELEYFRERPDAFYRLCAELWPGRFSPTPTHHFIRLLEKQGKLARCYTQNIDSLESAAG